LCFYFRAWFTALSRPPVVKKSWRAARLKDRSYFGPSQTPARLLCFVQSFNNFNLCVDKPFELNWRSLIYLNFFSMKRRNFRWCRNISVL